MVRAGSSANAPDSIGAVYEGSVCDASLIASTTYEIGIDA